MKKNFDIISQVRFKSTRLPGKILLRFKNQSFLDYFLKNLKKIRGIRKIILACPKDEYSDIFKFISKKNSINIFIFKGDENNVLERYYRCAKKFKSDNIIRITSDCPFIPPSLVQKMIKYYSKNNIDFLTNNKPRLVPHGFDCEILSFKTLKKIFINAKKAYDKEHVTSWFYRNVFKKEINYTPIISKNFSKIRLTLDTPKDYLQYINDEKLFKKVKMYKYFFK